MPSCLFSADANRYVGVFYLYRNLSWPEKKSKQFVTLKKIKRPTESIIFKNNYD